MDNKMKKKKPIKKKSHQTQAEATILTGGMGGVQKARDGSRIVYGFYYHFNNLRLNREHTKPQ